MIWLLLDECHGEISVGAKGETDLLEWWSDTLLVFDLKHMACGDFLPDSQDVHLQLEKGGGEMG